MMCFKRQPCIYSILKKELLQKKLSIEQFSQLIDAKIKNNRFYKAITNMHTKLLLATFVLCTFSAKAQTLFTYGDKAVSRQEFLTAFNKNPDTAGNRAEKLQQYLSLYENFKLKIQAAYDEKLHQTSQFKLDAENFREQLTENYINEQANIQQLVHEAFLRSQKDILIAEIFVENKTADTTFAYAQIQKAYNSLAAGNSFEKTVQEFSTDTAEKALNGIVGYITVFSLPYEVENILYNLKPGNFSAVYHSGAGYHILKYK